MNESLRGPSGLRLNRETRRVWVGEQEVDLSRTLFDLLSTLLQQRGRVVETSELVRAAWGYDEAWDIHFVRTAVYRLRQRLRDAGADQVIESVRGVGFRIADDDDDEQAVEAQRASELALQTASTAIFLLNAERRIVWANPAALELTGYDVAELQALQSSEDLSPPEQRELRHQAWLRVLSGKHLRRSEVDVMRKDGEWVSADASWKPLRSPEGAVEFAILEFWPPAGPHSQFERRAS